MTIRYLFMLALFLSYLYPRCQNVDLLRENMEFPISSEFRFAGGSGEKNIRIPDLKGKKVIIDFFTSSCVVCFRVMPKVDTIREKFKDKVQFLFIGKDDAKIRSIYKRIRDRFNLKFDVAFDSVIFKMLRIHTVPTYVWLDENGIVKAVTGPDEVTEDNIDFFVNNKEISRKKSVSKISFDPSKLLYVDGNGGGNNRIELRSLIAKWSPDLPYYLPPKVKMEHESDKFQILGASSADLYRYAFFGVISWDIRDSNYTRTFPDPVIIENDIVTPMETGSNYCYSLYKSGASLSEGFIRSSLEKDLELYFGYVAKMEFLEVPCWRLTLTDEKKLPASREKKEILLQDAAGLSAVGQPISKIIEAIYRFNKLEPPILDCTGITHKIDININAMMTDMNDIARSLPAFGLRLEKSKAIMKAIVLNKVNK